MGIMVPAFSELPSRGLMPMPCREYRFIVMISLEQEPLESETLTKTADLHDHLLL
jgi:hypothetical protein